MARISVIMPIYNEEKYVAAAVEAILCQTSRDFELLLVDDGSTDATARICTDFAARDSRIRLLRQNHGGVSAARNAGMAAAVGDYLYFTDADDYTEPTLLADISEMADESGADMVEFGFYREIYDAHDRCGSREMVLPAGNGILTRRELSKHLCSCICDTTYYISGHLFRRTLLDGLRFPMLPLAEDAIFVMRALQNTETLAFCQKAYYHYTVRIGSSVNRYQPQRLDCDLELMKTLQRMLAVFNCDAGEAEQIVIDRCAGSYLNVIYNVSLPDCPLSFSERYQQMKQAKTMLRIQEFRRRFRINGNRFERFKLILLHHRLELLMLLFGRVFICLFRKR